jgi:flagellar basal body-associated protein FliL
MNKPTNGLGEWAGCATALIVLAAVVVAAIVIIGAPSFESWLIHGAEASHQERMAALPDTEHEYALYQQAEVATELGDNLVAVAVSADISQTQIAQAIPSSLWAIALIIVSITALVIVLTLKPRSSEQSSSVYHPSHEYSNRQR